MSGWDEGTVVAGRFEVRGLLLEGRHSSLYRAMDRATGSPMVLRRLQEGATEEARQQLLREGRLLARLQHRNLPRILEVMEDQGRVVLVGEELAGRTLAAYVAEVGPVDDRLLRRWLAQLLSVLDFLHTRTPPIVHRDLRPDTILLTPHGVLKLGDFGLARLFEAGEEAHTAFRSVGSPHYAAPEQLLQAPSHPGNDLYSVGALLLFLATGELPPRSLDRKAAPPSLAERRGFPPEMDGLIARLMHPDPEQRFASAREVSQQLQELFPAESASLALPAFLVREAVAPAQAPAPKPSMWELLFGARRAVAAPLAGPDEKELSRFPRVDLTSLQVDREVARILPEECARSIEGICIGRRSEGEITVAVKDPTQVHIYDHVSLATGGRCRPVLLRAEPVMIDLAREFVYRPTAATAGVSWLEWLERKKFVGDTLDVKSVDRETPAGDSGSPVVAAVDRLIKEAISLGASDIHLENSELELTVRYRIDGVLHGMESFDRRTAAAITKRLKIMANMDIAQERVTQSGRISVRVKDQDYDLRVSIVPVAHGENAVLRLLR
ncbi:MAG: ATPase, T2SS/T4P/T4SS family, partial [Candidatus Eremiobacterota bacterium]